MEFSRLFFATLVVAACGCAPALADEPQCKKGCICMEEGTDDVTAVSSLYKEEVREPERIFTTVEQPASFPGGAVALNSWLAQNLHYPEDAVKQNIEGRVIVQFVVETDGSLTHPVVVRGVDKNLDKEAIRIVKRMPKWRPGKNNGKAVRSKYTLPVRFRL